MTTEQVKEEVISPDGYEVHTLLRGAFLDYWPVIDHLLGKCPEVWSPYWNKGQLIEQVMNGELDVWVVSHDGNIHMFAFTQVICTPTRKILNFHFAIGEKKRCLPYFDAVIEQFCIKCGISAKRVVGRRAWAWLLAPFGFREVGVVLEAPVSKGMN